MHFVIHNSIDNQYFFTIVGANYEVVATSETYYSKYSAKKTIDSIRNNINPDSFVIDVTDI